MVGFIKLKRIFLVDFENVHIGGLKGIKSQSEQDDIVLFYSDNDADTIATIHELCDNIKYAKIVRNGPNALDFQLSSYLG
ncbi:MAG: iron ABC transporter substrate-binding protein, partial [Gracilibacteraceae bacterium]|nr:iron ABC transporter substrate-binding protein [Gracilibacteraceae bacterium]